MTSEITFALPKGRVFDDIIRFMNERGLSCRFNQRELIAYDKSHSIKWLLVKNSDVPIYVHNGVAMLGISGTDMLTEYGLPLARLLTLPFGAARMSLISLPQQAPLKSGTYVATKYPHVTRSHFLAKGLEPSIIHLHGSLELAPLLGLAPYIVDIVQTGATISTHGLVDRDTLFDTTMVIVANISMYKYNYKIVRQLLGVLADT